MCTYRLSWARITSWGWWDEWMTLPSRHRIWNLIHGGLRPSTLLFGHGGSPKYWFFYERARKKHFVPLKLQGQSGGLNPRSPTLQAGNLRATARTEFELHRRLIVIWVIMLECVLILVPKWWSQFLLYCAIYACDMYTCSQSFNDCRITLI